MKRAHYLRVARALALATAVPVVPVMSGCSGTSAPMPHIEPHLVAAGDAHTAPADAGTSPDDAGDVDANLPFSSGPIVPPELPAGFA